MKLFCLEFDIGGCNKVATLQSESYTGALLYVLELKNIVHLE